MLDRLFRERTRGRDLDRLRLSATRVSSHALTFCICARLAYPFPIRIVEGLQFDDIWMTDNAHDLQLSILPKSVPKLFRDGE